MAADRLHLVGFSPRGALEVPGGFGAAPAEGGTVVFQFVGDDFGREDRAEDTGAALARAWAALCDLARQGPVAAFRFGQVVGSPDDAARACDLAGMAQLLSALPAEDAEEWSISLRDGGAAGGAPEDYLSRLSARRASLGDRVAALETAMRDHALRVAPRSAGKGGERRWQLLVSRADRDAVFATLSKLAEDGDLRVTATGPEPVLTFLGDDSGD